MKRTAGRAAKPVNSLVWIPYRKNVLCDTLARELFQHLNLRIICILKFVHQDKSCPCTLPFEQSRVFLQELMRPQNHVSECAKIAVAQHPLNGFEDERNFPASPQRLFV